MSDLIDREYAINKFCEYGTYLERHGVPIMTLCDAKQRAVDLIESLPSAQQDDRLNKIAELVDGTIDHFDRDDAMDLLYQIKEVLK